LPFAKRERIYSKKYKFFIDFIKKYVIILDETIRVYQMKIETIKCIKCGATQAIKNGFVDGWQRYKCKDCGYQYTKQNPHGKSIFVKILASTLFLFGMSYRQIANIIGVTPMSVGRWIKKYHIYYMTAINPLENRKILTKTQVKKMIEDIDSDEILTITRTLPSGAKVDLFIHK